MDSGSDIGQGSLFSPGAKQIEDWQARLELATLLANTGQYDEAAAEYKKVLAARPGQVEAKVGLARALMWSGKEKEAASVMESVNASRLGSDDRMLLADLAIAGEDFPRAELLLKQRLAEKPDDLKARFKLAEVFSWTDRFDESALEYEIILKARPGDIQTRRKYAQVLSWAGRDQDAIRELKKTLAD